MTLKALATVHELKLSHFFQQKKRQKSVTIWDHNKTKQKGKKFHNLRPRTVFRKIKKNYIWI